MTRILTQSQRETAVRRTKEWRLANPERHRATYQKWREVNRERLLAKTRSHQKQHREEYLLRSRQWYLAHREDAIRKSAAYRVAHQTVSRDYFRKYRANHKDEVNANSRKYRRLHPGVGNDDRQYRRVLRLNAPAERISLRELRKRDRNICQICKGGVGLRGASIDHIVPISHGGSHTWANVQLAHTNCNAARGTGRIPAQLRLAV